VFETLRLVPLFAHLSDEDLESLCTSVERIHLSDGEFLFREGDSGDAAFVIEAGELEIFKASAGKEVLLAVRHAGEVIGEMSLLEDNPRNASGAARGSCVVLSIDKNLITRLLATSPSAASGLFKTILDKVRSTEGRLRQSERMAQLGTMTAGVAHELNNPAAAVKRASEQLAELVEGQASRPRSAGEMNEPQTAEVAELMARARAAARPPLDSLEQADLEDEVSDWLESTDMDSPWEVAASLVGMGLDTSDLDRLDGVLGDHFVQVLMGASEAHSIAGLVREIASGSARISEIVKALKSYSFLDQAPIQEVDVVDGIEDTLLILKSKLRSIRLIRDYQDDLPRIQGYGSELNQVWTNLLDNAADSITSSEMEEGIISIRSFVRDKDLVVEVEDNGPGIPADIVDRVFDSFFTTKAPGKGTGLGLDISYGIVADKHRGEVVVTSEPGSTVFSVTLPLADPSDEGTDMSAPCEELENVPMEDIAPGGCFECIELGDVWVHLRYCVDCQMIRCCDSSKNQHASKHAAATDHVVVRSAEPGDSWAFCYTHEEMISTA
jgi:signal transduction histidine kinase